MATAEVPAQAAVAPTPSPVAVATAKPRAPQASEFGEFYARWSRDALRYAWTVAGPAGAEDACQDAWERIWRHWDRGDPERREAWALRIVRNCCLDRLRSGARLTLVAEPGAGLASTGDTEGEALARVEVDRSLALLGRLTPPLREALWLREVGELTYAEIAALQGVPIGTVMSRLHSARRKASRILSR